MSPRRPPFRTPVWMYHHVEPQPLVPPAHHPASYLSPEAFGRQLDELLARGYRTATFSEAVEAWRRGGPPARRTVVVTFDDGCRCFVEHALPALLERRMTATLFAVSGELGGTNRWDAAAGERRERLLGAGELRELASLGIEIGAHSRSHARLTACDPGCLADEVAGCRRDLETALGRPVTTFCYPYGHSNREVRQAVRAAGFVAAASILGHPGAAFGDPYAVPRMILGPGDSRLELALKASGAYRWWRHLPRLGLLAALRHRRQEAR